MTTRLSPLIMLSFVASFVHCSSGQATIICCLNFLVCQNSWVFAGKVLRLCCNTKLVHVISPPCRIFVVLLSSMPNAPAMVVLPTMPCFMVHRWEVGIRDLHQDLWFNNVVENCVVGLGLGELTYQMGRRTVGHRF